MLQFTKNDGTVSIRWKNRLFLSFPENVCMFFTETHDRGLGLVAHARSDWSDVRFPLEKLLPRTTMKARWHANTYPVWPTHHTCAQLLTGWNGCAHVCTLSGRKHGFGLTLKTHSHSKMADNNNLVSLFFPWFLATVLLLGGEGLTPYSLT